MSGREPAQTNVDKRYCALPTRPGAMFVCLSSSDRDDASACAIGSGQLRYLGERGQGLESGRWHLRRKYRVVTLRNKLRALLISDAQAVTASAVSALRCSCFAPEGNLEASRKSRVGHTRLRARATSHRTWHEREPSGGRILGGRLPPEQRADRKHGASSMFCRQWRSTPAALPTNNTKCPASITYVVRYPSCRCHRTELALPCTMLCDAI